MASADFSIEDAFQSDEEDPIRVYGAFCDSAPLRKSGSTIKATSGRDLDPVSIHSDGSNEITDTSVGLLSGQIEGRGFYRTTSSQSFGSTGSGGAAPKPFTDKRWWKHPKVKDNWKVVLAASILLLLGLGLFVAGIIIELSHTEVVQSFVFFIAGAICLIPGAYHVVYIYCAVKGKRGFSFYNLPVFK